MFFSGLALYVLFRLSLDTASTTDRGFRGILFGHSFIERFGEHLNVIRGDEQRSNQDLLGLSELVDSLEVIGRSGAQLDYFESFCKAMRDHRYGTIDFLVVDMGSNDLDQKKNPLALTKRMVELGHELIEGSFVQSIVFMHVAARAQSHSNRFAKDRQIFNDELSKLVEHEKQLSYHEMTNFTEDTIDRWSSDGIHPITEIGFQMYFHAIQRAVLTAIKLCT